MSRGLVSDPIGKAVREQRRRNRFGDDATCVRCGLSDLRALVLAPAGLIEMDHLHGRQRDPDTLVPYCRNCHAIVTEERRDAGIPMRPGPNPLIEAAMTLKSRGLHHLQLGRAELRQAQWLLGLNDYLQEEHPEIEETLYEYPSTYPPENE